MEYRKLVKFGAATYCVSLPKNWVREHKLSKGDVLSIEAKDDGSLKVHSKETAPHSRLKEITIDISNMGIEEIRRRVLVAYINDFSVITLRGNIEGQVKALREIFQQFVALEVLELTDERITAKAFIDASETNPLKVMRRIDLLTRTMFGEVAECACNPSKMCFLEEKDLEVTRLHFFALKLITRGLGDTETAHHWGFTKIELAFIMSLANEMERIADRLKRLSKSACAASFGEAERQLMQSHFVRADANYREAMTAFYKNDTTLAHRVIDEHEANLKALDTKTFRCLSSQRVRLGCGIPMVLEFLARISTLTEDIARIVLDLHPLDGADEAAAPKRTLIVMEDGK